LKWCDAGRRAAASSTIANVRSSSIDILRARDKDDDGSGELSTQHPHTHNQVTEKRKARSTYDCSREPPLGIFGSRSTWAGHQREQSRQREGQRRWGLWSGPWWLVSRLWFGGECLSRLIDDQIYGCMWASSGSPRAEERRLPHRQRY
jgi:hypothetical protein